MSPFALIATLEFEAVSKEEIVQALLAHRSRCLKDELGTLQFEILIPHESTTQVILFELYASREAFDAHSQNSSLATFRQQVGKKIVNVHHHPCDVANPLAQPPAQ